MEDIKDTRRPPPADFSRCAVARHCVISGFCKRSRPPQPMGQSFVYPPPLSGTLMPGRVPCAFFEQEDWAE